MSWCRGLPPHLHAPTHNTARTPPHANISALTGNVVLLLLRIHENNTPHNEQSEQLQFHQSVIPPTLPRRPHPNICVLRGTTLTNPPIPLPPPPPPPHRPRHHLYLADPPQNSAKSDSNDWTAGTLATPFPCTTDTVSMPQSFHNTRQLRLRTKCVYVVPLE